MAIQTSDLENKVKANGKWVASEVKDVARDVSKDLKNASSDISSSGSDVMTTVQDGISDLFNTGSTSAQNAGKTVLDFAQKYPVQAAVGGLVVGLFLGSKLFTGRRA